jgi:hypothetical protein
MGWEVVKEYADEGLSGTLSRDKRPALNSLIQDAYRKRFDSVVCWDISRIGRSMKELILFLSDMKDRGIGMVPAVAMSSTRNWPRSRRADGHTVRRSVTRATREGLKFAEMGKNMCYR